MIRIVRGVCFLNTTFCFHIYQTITSIPHWSGYAEETEHLRYARLISPNLSSKLEVVLHSSICNTNCCAKNRSSIITLLRAIFCDICSAATRCKVLKAVQKVAASVTCLQIRAKTCVANRRCKLALQIDQCNTTFSPASFSDKSLKSWVKSVDRNVQYLCSLLRSSSVGSVLYRLVNIQGWRSLF